MIKIEDHIIHQDENIKTAMTRLNRLAGRLTLFVINDENKLTGTLTDGDIRRGLIAGKTIEQKVKDFMYPHFRYIMENNIDVFKIKQYREQSLKLLPVINQEGKITKIIDLTHTRTCLPVDAVIMAGGRGERLRPLTDTLPKPLLKLGDKSILEHNLSLLSYYGIEDIYITVNYLAEKIRQAIGNDAGKGLRIKYIQENQPMGTLGAVSLINDFKHKVTLVMNSDLFTNIDLEEMFQTLEEEKADAVVATVPYNIDIPFAVFEVRDNHITSLHEKPTYTYHTNAGIYLFRTALFKYLPSHQRCDVTDYLQILLQHHCKIVKFPVLGYWMDIGRMEDYKKAQEYYKYLQIR